MAYKFKGSHFTTQELPDGEVRICWSETTPDTTKWDPLDFWIVPPERVKSAIAEVREGFTLEENGASR